MIIFQKPTMLDKILVAVEQSYGSAFFIHLLICVLTDRSHAKCCCPPVLPACSLLPG